MIKFKDLSGCLKTSIIISWILAAIYGLLVLVAFIKEIMLW